MAPSSVTLYALSVRFLFLRQPSCLTPFLISLPTGWPLPSIKGS